MKTVATLPEACRRFISSYITYNSVILFVTVIFLITGCANQSYDQGHIRPSVRIDHAPVDTDADRVVDVNALLNEAEAELQKANAAHEQGNFDAAQAHYQLVLKLLLDANLDPALFYESNGQLEAILKMYLKHAHLYHHPEGRLGSSKTGVYNDIAISLPLPKYVEAEIAELRERYPGTFQRGLDRSARYMPYIREYFRSQGLPEDLAWLAMVESMFRPDAVSPAGAGGMWQFMRATGRRFSLRMDSYVDERKNWRSSTQAAAEYLKCLYNFFDGDWSLAVTAYNMGEGGLSRAMEANGGDRNFWNLIETPPASERIKQESKKYYPRLLAYIVVANAPERYGFNRPDSTIESIDFVPVNGRYNLAELDKTLGLNAGTLSELNPDLIQKATPPQGEYMMAVPLSHREQLLAALKTTKPVQYAAPVEKAPASAPQKGGVHRVRKGETISSIARTYGVSEQQLMQANRIRNARQLQANQSLHIPGVVSTSKDPALALAQEKASTVTVKESAASTYTVKTGDTLSAIACSHKTSVTALTKLNNLKEGDCIRVGQVLNLGTAAAPAQESAPRYHEVKSGEYPSVIAKLYGVSTPDLLRWNNLTPQSVIRAGDRLVIGGPGGKAASTTAVAEQNNTPSKAQKAEVKTHKIAPGETASAIAARYGVKTANLLAANDLTAKSILIVGHTLTIPQAQQGISTRDQSKDIQLSKASQKKTVHTVTAGQNPTSIAQRYGVKVKDLFEWNNWPDAPVLRVGDKVSIYQD